MKLSQLLYHLYDATLYNDVEITGLALDSRKVQPGDLFFACKGSQQDGRVFIEDAINKGAKAVLEEVDSSLARVRKQQEVIILPVEQLLQRIGPIAATFYGNPSQKTNMVGITGTNGKTSCAFFVAQALHALGQSCGVIGTLGNGLYGAIKEGSLTTPDAITLQALLADFVKHKAHTVAMEVSSHSLEQGRVNGIKFEVGVFTNLSRDHLDYHGTMEAYGKAKQKLFEENKSRHAVINADDAFGKTLLSHLPAKTSYAYSIDPAVFSTLGENKIYADAIQLDHEGIRATVYSPWGEGSLHVPLLGWFNLSNVLATLTSLCLLKIPFAEVLQSLSHLSPVPGRMQRVGGQGKPYVVVDYAHTPDALEKVLKALRTHCQGKLLCLFGCGGDRDKGKRPLMAKVVENYADVIVVTDDNPRTEDPAAIVKDIVAGFTHPEKINIQHNRSKAIADIIQYAEANDYVLIAGKGAETYQQIGAEKIPFSDIEKVMENLNARLVK